MVVVIMVINLSTWFITTINSLSLAKGGVESTSSKYTMVTRLWCLVEMVGWVGWYGWLVWLIYGHVTWGSWVACRPIFSGGEQH